jgi:polysaccharide biosynthesis transport protein
MNVTQPSLPHSRSSRTLPADETYAWDDEIDEVGNDEPAIDLRAIWSAIVRNRWIIAAILALCLLGGVAASMLSVPQYRATASVQIDQRAAKVLGTEDEEVTGSSAEADRYLQTQVDVIKSRALAIQVAEAQKLYSNDGFLTAVGIERTPELTPDRLRLAVLGSLQTNLSVNLPRNSRVVTISFASRSPGVSADVANAFVREYIDSSLQRRFDQSAYARRFLSEQLAQAKARLAQSELDANAYARAQGLIDTSEAAPAGSTGGGGQRSLTTSDLVQLNQAYTAARAARLQAQQRFERARSTAVTSLPEVLGNPAVQQLSRQRAELEASYQQERQRHKEDFPSVRQAQAAMDAIDQQIGRIGASVLNSLRYAYQAAADEEQAFRHRIDELKRATLSEQDRSVQFNILRRESDTNRQLYEALLQRFREVSAASGATNNNIAVIDQAEPPTAPFAPRPAMNLALAGLLGLALSGAIVFAREQFDDAIREPNDTEMKLGLPLLGVLPRASDNPMTELASPRSPLAEAAQALRTSLELSAPDGMPGSVLMTSSRQGEGKSTTSVLVALMLAQAGKRVLLVDADLRKPSLHQYLGLQNEVGLSTVLAGQGTLEGAVQRSETANLSLVTSGPMPPDPAQLLASPQLGEFVQAWSKHYDRIIIDAPPVLGLADAPLLASVARAVIFVVEADRAHRGGAKAALKRLAGARAIMLGAVLTKKSGRNDADGYAYYGYGTQKPKRRFGGGQ